MAMQIVNVRQRTPEWHAWRAGGVSASDAAVLVDESPYKTPWRLWAEKVGYAEPEDLSRNPAVLRGIEFEPVAGATYEQEHNEMLLPVCVQSVKHPILRASLDGLDSQNRPVELKCPTLTTWDKVIHEGLQSTAVKLYSWQVQYQLLVTGAKEGFLVFYNVETKQMRRFVIKADKELHEKLIEQANLFWQSVQSRKAPKKDPFRDLYIPEGEQAQEWIGAAEAYRMHQTEIDELKARISQLQEQQKPHVDQMRQLMGDYCFAEFCGVSITSTLSQGRVDYRQIVEERLQMTEPELELYRAESSTRTRVTMTETLVPRRIIDNDVAKSLEGTTGTLESWYY